MGTGWRKVLCTAIRRDAELSSPDELRTSSSPKKDRGMFDFFRRSGSRTSTPRLQRQTQSEPSTPALRCRTGSPARLTIPDVFERVSQQTQAYAKATVTEATTPRSYRPSPGQPSGLSNPPSPRSPSRLALLLKSSLRFSRSRCGICYQSMKSVKGAAIFTAECSHAFHLHCIASNLRQRECCPICSAPWCRAPLFCSVFAEENQKQQQEQCDTCPRRTDAASSAVSTFSDGSPRKAFDDDEPLLDNGNACFHPIPEAEEEHADEEPPWNEGLRRPFSNSCPSTRCVILLAVSSDPAFLSRGSAHENHVVALKVKSQAPVSNLAAPLLDPSRRAPIDLVTVLDVSSNTMTGAKLQMLRRAMRLLLSCLGARDRLSIVTASSPNGVKRLLPLRRMSVDGQRLARRVVERLVSRFEGSCGVVAQREGLRKAGKVLEERRESNPVAAVLLLSDRPPYEDEYLRRLQSPSSSTRFVHMQVPVNASGAAGGENQEAAERISFARCVGGRFSVVCQDVSLEVKVPSGQVLSVYSGGRRPVALGSANHFRVGDLHDGEEREFLVELKMSPAAAQRRQPLVVRCFYRDPTAQKQVRGDEHSLQLFFTRRPDRAAGPKVELLRNAFITTRAVAEARRLADAGDFATGLHLLVSARRLLLQCSLVGHDENVRAVDHAIEEIRRCSRLTPCSTRSALGSSPAAEALTPMSAWRAAERLAKVAIMRKSLNRVSDLHGFENARF